MIGARLQPLYQLAIQQRYRQVRAIYNIWYLEFLLFVRIVTIFSLMYLFGTSSFHHLEHDCSGMQSLMVVIHVPKSNCHIRPPQRRIRVLVFACHTFVHTYSCGISWACAPQIQVMSTTQRKCIYKPKYNENNTSTFRVNHSKFVLHIEQRVFLKRM